MGVEIVVELVSPVLAVGIVVGATVGSVGAAVGSVGAAVGSAGAAVGSTVGIGVGSEGVVIMILTGLVRIIKFLLVSSNVAELAIVLEAKLIVVPEGAADETLREREATFCPVPEIRVPVATPAEPVIFPG